MMLVPTYVAASDIEGVGVFAAAPIAKGDLIWQFDPSFDRLISARWLSEQAPLMQDFFRKYAYPAHHQSDSYILEVDNGRFMNHSTVPNTDFFQIVKGFAIRDIEPGEEFLCDYSQFDPAFELLPTLAFTAQLENVAAKTDRAETGVL